MRTTEREEARARSFAGAHDAARNCQISTADANLATALGCRGHGEKVYGAVDAKEVTCSAYEARTRDTNLLC